MRDTIDNVRDVTDHATKMAFFCGIPRETADITKQATEEIRHYSRVKPEIKYTLFQRERAIFIPCSRVIEAKKTYPVERHIPV